MTAYANLTGDQLHAKALHAWDSQLRWSPAEYFEAVRAHLALAGTVRGHVEAQQLAVAAPSPAFCDAVDAELAATAVEDAVAAPWPTKSPKTLLEIAHATEAWGEAAKVYGVLGAVSLEKITSIEAQIAETGADEIFDKGEGIYLVSVDWEESQYEDGRLVFSGYWEIEVIDFQSFDELEKADAHPPRCSSCGRPGARWQLGAGIVSAAAGFEEGQACGRDGCKGHIETRASEDCSCHISPPCHSCTAPRNFCPECDWDEAGEPKPEPKPATQAEKDYWAAWSKEQDRLRNLPLDNTKVSWRSAAHSSCSMVKEGVYPEGTTQAEVRKLVDGTFGGRFEQFGGGRFKFIAYTD